MESDFDWDEGNIRHIARHAVIPEEAEQAIGNDPLDLGAQTVDGEERFLSIPAFPTEAEEAAWWDSHQDLVEQRFLEAAAAGALGQGRVARQAVTGKTSGASPTLTLRVPETDISRARTLAARKGLRYQTLLQMLIHEGLEREEQRAG